MSDDFDEPLTGFDQPISPAEPQERLGDGARLARLAEKLRPSD